MKKFFKIIIICFVLVLIGASSSSALAYDRLFDKDSFAMLKSNHVFVKDAITVCADDCVYLIGENDEKTIKHIADTKKALYFADEFYYLTQDGSLYCENTILDGSVLDFDVNENGVFFVKDDGLYSYVDQVELLCAFENAFSVAVSDDSVFVACYDVSATVYSYSLTTSTTSLVYEHKLSFERLAFDNSVLYGLDDNTIYDFNTKTVVHPEAVSVAINDGKTYYLRNDNLYCDNTLVAGINSPLRYPTKVLCVGEKVFIADETSLKIFSCTNLSVAQKTINLKISCFDYCPITDTLYYSKDNMLYSLSGGVPTKTEYESNITSISCDYQFNVYVCANGLYKNSPSNKVCDNTSMIATNKAKSKVYYYYDGSIYQDGTKLFDCGQINDFEVDDDDNIYILAQNSLAKYSVSGEALEDYSSTLENATYSVFDITISKNSNTFAKLVLCDTYGHDVVITDIECAIYKKTAQTQHDNAIYTVIDSVAIYSDLTFTAIDNLEVGENVICLQKDISENDFVSLVAKLDNGSYVCGYVPKWALNENLGGAINVDFGNATTFYDNVALYFLPYTLNLEPNKIVTTIPSAGTHVDLVAKYEILGEVFYKATVNGFTGYIPAFSVKIGNYDPNVFPVTNATVKSNTAVYESEGVLAENSLMILQGTKVEVLQTFDSNQTYTRIRYYDAEAGGTRTCYVLTSSLSYDYMTPEQNIAAVMIVILSIITVVCLVIGVKMKMKK